jgi:hypothetical protein
MCRGHLSNYVACRRSILQRWHVSRLGVAPADEAAVLGIVEDLEEAVLSKGSTSVLRRRNLIELGVHPRQRVERAYVRAVRRVKGGEEVVHTNRESRRNFVERGRAEVRCLLRATAQLNARRPDLLEILAL